MDEYVLTHFDWSPYIIPAGSRFLDGREGVFLSNGFHNLVKISLLCGVIWWALGLLGEFLSLRYFQFKMEHTHKVVHLKGMAEFYEDLRLLTKEHFNTVVKLHDYVVPLPIARIRMPGNLIAKSLRLQLGEGHDDEVPENPTPASESAALTTSLDNLEVSFSMDCSRTTFVSAHWGVSAADLHNICVDGRKAFEEAPSVGFSIRRFLRGMFNSDTSHSYQSLLDTKDSMEFNATDDPDSRYGRFNAVAFTDKICSNEAVCYDAGSGILCSVSPPVKTVDIDGEPKSIWEALICRNYAGKDIIPLVVVLYSPRTHDAKVFSEGSVESYLGVAEITLVSFSGTFVTGMSVLRGPTNPHGMVIEGCKQVCFSNDFGRPQEPRDMFGMGDEVDSDCLICLCTRMDTVLMPCGHASFCYDCLQSLRTEKCPVCRAPFKSYVRFPLVAADNA